MKFTMAYHGKYWNLSFHASVSELTGLNLTMPQTKTTGLKVIKLEYTLRLKIKRNDWHAANHCALFWIWEWTQVL